MVGGRGRAGGLPSRSWEALQGITVPRHIDWVWGVSDMAKRGQPLLVTSIVHVRWLQQDEEGWPLLVIVMWPGSSKKINQPV